MASSSSQPASPTYTTHNTPYPGAKNSGIPRGCVAQVNRAKEGVDLTALEEKERPFLTPPPSFQGIPTSTAGLNCRCQIAENGLIDPSNCPGGHLIAPIPTLTRWYGDTIDRVHGACYLHGWSGWAAPSVMALLGRRPVVQAVHDLFMRSHKGVKHTFQYEVNLAYTAQCGTEVYHITRVYKKTPTSMHFIKLINSLPKNARIGESSLPDATGQTEKVKATMSFAAEPIEALGGVRQVPTSMIVPRVAEGMGRTWEPRTWVHHMLNDRTVWNLDRTTLELRHIRGSSFVYHYPKDLANPQLPNTFDVELESRWFHPLPVTAANVVATDYSRSFDTEVIDRSVLDNFSAIGELIDGSLSNDTLKEADNVGAFSRAMGSRAQRLVPGWEAGLLARWQRFRDAATRSKATRNYREFAYRVVTRYLLTQVVADMMLRIPRYERVVNNTTTNVQIIHINAESIIPPPPAPGAPPPLPIWGEEQLWTPQIQQALADGRAQFIDGESYSREEIAQIIGCLAPSTHDNVPHLRTEEGVQLDPGQQRYQLPNIVRHIFPNRVETIFVHHGNSPIPNAADQAWIQAHAFDFPDASALTLVMRAYSQRHGLGQTFTDAFDMAIYRTVGFKFEDALGTDQAKQNNRIIDANGSDQLFLPGNNTWHSYWDVFYAPVPAGPTLESFLAMTAQVTVHAGSLCCHARAVSLAWASKAATNVGNVWGAPQVNPNQFIRNYRDKWNRMYYNEINIWSALFANAQATQFGFAPSSNTRRSEECRVIDWWSGYMPPTLRNHYLELWMMQVIPTFQVLPYFSQGAATSHVEWAKGTPDQVDSEISFAHEQRVKLAREFDPFPGHAWLGDGGAEYNAQFYVAQGNDGQFAYQGGHHKTSLFQWEGTYARSFPAAPAPGALRLIAPRGSHFSDFLLPGSLQSYRHQTDRILNWGVSATRGRPLTALESRRWWRASKGEAHNSLMVNYISPIAEHYEIDSLADYSVTVWESSSGFAYMTFSNITNDLHKSSFDPVNTIRTQKLFELNFDSAPRPHEQYHPTRITKAKPKADVADRPTPERINNALQARVAESGRIDYKSKYPLTTDELPDLTAIDTDVHEGKMHWSHSPDQAPPNFGVSPGGLQRLEEIQRARAKIDAEFQEYLNASIQEKAVNEARVRANHPRSQWQQPRSTNRQQMRKSLPADLYRRHSTSSTKQESPPPVRSGQRTYVNSGADIPTDKYVEPNDSAALEAQQQALEMSHLLRVQQPSGHRPAQVTAGSRRPGRPSRAPTPDVENDSRAEQRPQGLDSRPKYQEETEMFPILPNTAARIASNGDDPFKQSVDFSNIDWSQDSSRAQDQALQAFASKVNEVQASTTTAKN
jgi:hypothetical protein